MNKFGNMLLNELFHLLQSHSVRHSFLLEETILSFILVIRPVSVIIACTSFLAALAFTDHLSFLQAILDMVEPSEYIRLDRSDLEEHFQALLEVALKLLEQDSEFEERGRRGLFNEPLNDLGAQIILVPLDQAKDQVFILLHQVGISIVSAVFDLAS